MSEKKRVTAKIITRAKNKRPLLRLVKQKAFLKSIFWMMNNRDK